MALLIAKPIKNLQKCLQDYLMTVILLTNQTNAFVTMKLCDYETMMLQELVKNAVTGGTDWLVAAKEHMENLLVQLYRKLSINKEKAITESLQ